MSKDITIEAESVEATGTYNRNRVEVELKDVDYGSIIDAIGIEECLDIIGKEDVMKHFDLVEEKEE